MIRCLACLGLLCLAASPTPTLAEFRVGAAVVDVSPQQFPVLVNGGMLSRTADKVKTPINARALVLDDGAERIAIVVVDSCMMPRPLLDDVKSLAENQLGFRKDRILISATHTHTAPSCMGALGTDADETYVPFLRLKLVEAIAAAAKNLEPARVGWGVGNAAEFTALRRWIRRPDRVHNDPFGSPTVRANMHAARKLEDVIGESGPEDPDLSLIAFQSQDGRPLAVLGNFSMHYFSDQALSADYFGLFCEGLKRRVAPEAAEGQVPFVGLLSHGCSGDIWRRDYRLPVEQRKENQPIEEYTEALLDVAEPVWRGIEYRRDVTLAMAEARLPMKYRVPDQQRLEWGRRIVEAMGDRPPKDNVEVYAREQLILHERQTTEIVVQALRIGEIGIATTPCETYALTGLKIKAFSPLKQTMVIELANGGDGYIPPPEQHVLGGYNTWAARSAGLEVQAEPRITEAAVALLEQVTGKPRVDFRLSHGPAAEGVLALKPAAYWRLDEMAGPRARDASGNERDGLYEPGVVFYLEGPASEAFCREGQVNRSAHFAGGRLQSRFPGLADRCSVSMWIWNGMPIDGRDVTGWCLSRGRDHSLGGAGDHLGLGGTGGHAGKLIFQSGDTPPIAGKTTIERWTWAHVVFVRDGESVRVYLNGKPEIETKAEAAVLKEMDSLFVGGHAGRNFGWEGRIDEAAVFDRALTGEEVGKLSP